MQVGMIGLGRMGANMVRRLMRAGHECVVYDVTADAVDQLASEGADGAPSLEDFVDDTIERLIPLLQADDTVIDGGNSYYRDDLRRSALLSEHGLHYVDMGT